ncbi:DUF2599 domain-containing protein [Dermabacteraceae bacterium P13077]
MKNKTFTRMAALLVAFSAINPAAHALGTDEARHERTSQVTSSEYETLTQIFGHKPSKEEVKEYIEIFGEVPSKRDIEAYLHSNDKDGAKASTRLKPTSLNFKDFTEVDALIDQAGPTPHYRSRGAEWLNPNLGGAGWGNPNSGGSWATPNLRFTQAFVYGKWINRRGVVSLSLMPRRSGIGNEGKIRTWNLVYNRFHRNSNWTGKGKRKASKVNESMKKQYLCHFKYGMLKTPWNLEPHKRAEDVSFITCN